jgi:hypothetical protein
MRKALEKRRSATDGMTTVTFRVGAEAGAPLVELLGEFNEWSPLPLRPLDDGGHEITLELESRHTYRCRYLLDGRWENDWQADAYVPNHYGGEDSVIDLVATQDDQVDALDGKSRRFRGNTPSRHRTTIA